MSQRRPFFAVAATVPLLAALAFGSHPAGAAPSSSDTAGGPARPAAAGAGWLKINGAPADSLTEITLARSGDGALHAVYRVRSGGGEDYEHTALSTSGAVTGRSSVLGSWSGVVDDPVLLPTATGGLRLVFSGLRSTDSSDFYAAGVTYDALSDASGAAWSLQPHALTHSSSAYAGYGNGATTLSDGTPVSAATLNSAISYHVGTYETTDLTALNALPPDPTLTLPGCCAYNTTLVNSGDAVWMAWYANGSSAGSNGTFVQQIHPALGPVLKAPGSSVGSSSVAPDQRIAAVARPGGGVVLAYATGYPTTTKVTLWQVGTSSTSVVPDSAGADGVALATGPSGRLWVGWYTDDNRVFAARTAPTGLKVGAAVALGSPGGDIEGSAVDGALEQGTVVIQTTKSGSTSVLRALVKPGLLVKASPGKLEKQKKTQVKATVTDAGAGVAGVKVKGGGDSCTTKANGTCTLSLTITKPTSVKATKTGYGAGRTTVKVAK